MEEHAVTLNDYLAVLRRRRWPLLGTTLLILAASLVVAFALPPVYRSSATILIEQQEIPQDLVRSTVTTYADQRIQLINQRVMTSANLLEIIKKYGLYSERRESEPTEAILERMRDDILLDTVSGDVIDPRSGRSTEATIAFTVGYESDSPQVAQRVANELASLYLNENLKTRRRLAAETSSFLANEAEKLKAQVTTLERKLAEFKERHAGRLPEFVQLNMQLMDRVEGELLEAERQIRTQEQTRIYLRSQLSQLSATSGMLVTESGDRLPGPDEQLRALEIEYISLSARYAPDHPDVVRVRRQIAALRAEVGASGTPEEVRERLGDASRELSAAREMYSPEHPDVKRLARTVSSLEAELERTRTETTPTANTPPGNPAYIDMQIRLNATDSELSTLRTKRQELRAKRASYEDRLAESPQVERGYRNLMRDYDNALTRFREVKAKQLEAELAESLETERKAERFTLIEPPRLPQVPVKPDRLAIAFLGLVFSLGGGLGAATIVEVMDQSVRGAKQVARLLGEPPLGVIPAIPSPGGGSRVLSRRRFVGVLLISAAVLAVALFHGFVLPIDSAWQALLIRLGI